MTAAASSREASLAWLNSLREPQQALVWTLTDWARVISLARRSRLLARGAESLMAAGLMDQVPPQVRRHLLGEQRLSRARTTAVLWTIERIGLTLQGEAFPKVLLKGAAYLAQDLRIASGRLPSDLDILVPRADLYAAQTCLSDSGWTEADLDAHDQRYYHEWSHEVPPMTHPLHEVELDLHHNILPKMAHVDIDVNALLLNLKPSKWPGWQVLDPVDQLLHSAAHLFYDSEFRDRVRDLVDLDGLFREFGTTPSFGPRLLARARELGLMEPLALAVHFTTLWMKAPLPAEVLAAVSGPNRCVRFQTPIIWLFAQVLRPVEPDEVSRGMQRFAAAVLLARYHWRRMPLSRLITHAWHKWRAGARSALRSEASP